jgi:hypothetical protein
MAHKQPRTRTLIEYVVSIDNGSKVDRAASIIRDVVVIGSQSENGRYYPPDVLIDAVPLYENRPVYIDHQSDTNPTGARSYRNKIGRLTNVRFESGKVRADLIVNPEHELANQLFWDAENNPSAVGLSHDATGQVEMQEDGAQIVRRIEKVRSVDLVAEPATVTSLFEGKQMKRKFFEQAGDGQPSDGQTYDGQTGADQPAATDPVEALYQSLTLDMLKEKRPDLYDQMRKEVESEVGSALSDLKQSLADLQAQLDSYVTADQADQQMAEAKIFGVVPAALRDTIRRTKNREQRAKLIEEVKSLLGTRHDSAPFGLSAASTPYYRRTADEFFTRLKEMKS